MTVAIKREMETETNEIKRHKTAALKAEHFMSFQDQQKYNGT